MGELVIILFVTREDVGRDAALNGPHGVGVYSDHKEVLFWCDNLFAGEPKSGN